MPVVLLMQIRQLPFAPARTTYVLRNVMYFLTTIRSLSFRLPSQLELSNETGRSLRGRKWTDNEFPAITRDSDRLNASAEHGPFRVPGVFHKCFRTPRRFSSAGQGVASARTLRLPPLHRPPQGCWVRKDRLNYASKRSGSKVFSRRVEQAHCWLLVASPVSFVPLRPSAASTRCVAASPLAAWNEEPRYLSGPKQIFHGSVRSNLTQWGCAKSN